MKKLLALFVTIVTLSMFLFSACASTIYCATDGVRVRSKPVNKDNIIGKLEYGQEVTVIAIKGGWAKIKYKKGVGYVYSEYLQEKGKEWSSQNLGITKNSTKMLLSLKSKKIYIIPKNEVVRIVDSKDDMYAIKYGEKKGFVKAKDLETKSFKDKICIGAFTLTFHQNDAIRSNNIKKAVCKLNGTRLKAKKTFSFFKTIGTKYEEASEFMEDDTSIGGGLSHVATALKKALNSAQRNGCNIRFHQLNHFGFQTPYAKKNDEVKVSIQKKIDFSFTNKNNYDIRIYAAVRGDSVIVLVFK